MADSSIRIWDIGADLPRSVRRISDVFVGEAVTSVDYQVGTHSCSPFDCGRATEH